MKTLNEVIEELNIWDAYDDEYPDVFYDTQTIRDALHYLKEYQAILPLVPSLINTALAVQKKGKTIG